MPADTVSPTAEKIVADLGALLAGLQVPLSVGVPLGAALEPLLRLRGELGLFGWPTAEEISDELRKALDA